MIHYTDKTVKIILKMIFNSLNLHLNKPKILFETGVEPYFKGTWIYDKWTEPTYPVFRLSFLNLDNSSMDLFKKQLNSKITEFANKVAMVSKVRDLPKRRGREIKTLSSFIRSLIYFVLST